ncbi:branched-chain amino acid ABC transporter permease [Bradyrhizobium sp. Pear77]|uniref:branched-chain amino acid ABC transporter permease n=1 Tax=Bradyrhizobium TaxID=374 RepID=UPI001E39DBD7|nr:MULTISPECIES: branched-chain amino acid ABC transporter permease [Bradyrhizobium]MCC8954387.1 branched-chain amino acid ABC transporter permease [Bradyrhizobium altum]MCC8964353.1 branched-chain amino acid ABC transporter permease [Bradyrhizobium oropedii]
MSDITLDLARIMVVNRARWTTIEVAFWIAAAAGYFLFPAKLVLLTQMLIGGLFAMSLDLLLGYGGIASFGHAAFFGLGAYAAGLLAAHGWGEPLSGVLFGGLAAGGLGLAFSSVIAKVRGAAVLMVTLCIGLLLFEAASRMPWLTGGDTGLQGIDMWPLLGLFEFDLFGRTAFWYAYAVAFLLYLAARRYIHSPEGLALKGIRENHDRVPMLGVSTARRKMIAFTISATIAGMAGALLAQTTQIVALETLSFERSVAALIMLTVGGLGTLIGGFIGAATFIWARDVLSALNPVYWMFWLGLILIALMLTARGGLVGALTLLTNYLARERHPR